MNSDSKSKAPPISVFKAFWHAMWSLDIKYDALKKGPNGIDLSQAITDIKKVLISKNVNDADVEIHLNQAKISYNEVKAATEYQDQKAARLLTILAFLTAAAATIFAKFIDIYSIQAPDRHSPAEYLISTIYLGFCVYFFVIAVGALTTFYATQTRFTIPEESKFKSVLFFKGILSSTPEDWGGEFVFPKTDLARKYLESYVVETYLIALKTNVKVQYLRPAQAILQFAIKILFVVIFLLTFALLFVPRDAKKQEKYDANQAVTSTHNVLPSGSVPPQTAEAKSAMTRTDTTPVAPAPVAPAQAPTTKATTNITGNKPSKGEKPSGS